MRIVLTGIIIFLIIFIFWFLRETGLKEKGKRENRTEKGSEKIDRCTEILGLGPGASKEEVEQAYRDLANVWHPDRFANNPRLQEKAEEKLKEINSAYQYIRFFYRWK